MNFRQTLTHGLIHLSAFGLALGSTAGAALAQSSTDALGVSLTPLVREVTINPGGSYSGTVDVTNNATNTVTFFPLVRDFTASDDSSEAAPKFFETTPADYSAALASFVKFTETSLVIASKETKSLHYTVDVPKDAAPGGHYGGIFVATEAPTPTGKAEVAIGARVGSLLLVTVTGNIKAQGTLTEFTTVNDQGEVKSLFESNTINFRAKTSNTGNVHLQPTGTIAITKKGSTKQLASIDFNKEGGRVLPKSDRIYTESIEPTFGFGKFTATLTATLVAPNGDKFPITQTTDFSVMPVTTIVLGLLILIVLIVVFKMWLKQHDMGMMTGNGSSKSGKMK